VTNLLRHKIEVYTPYYKVKNVVFDPRLKGFWLGSGLLEESVSVGVVGYRCTNRGCAGSIYSTSLY